MPDRIIRAYVYAMHSGSQRLCKIGVSVRPKLRLAAVRSEWGWKLGAPDIELLFCRLFDNAYLGERRAHHLLRKRRWAGEWFHVDPRTAITAISLASEKHWIWA